MGQAKSRGTREQRVKEAIEANEAFEQQQEQRRQETWRSKTPEEKQQALAKAALEVQLISMFMKH